MGLSAAAYARMLKQLLPPGAIWKLESDTLTSNQLMAIADELARVDARGGNLIDEWDPRTALELLAEWENALGLPDDCLDAVPVTIAERRLAVVQKLASRGGQSRAFYVELAALAGFAVTIEEFSAQVLRSGFRCGSRLYGTDWAYAWRVTSDSGEAPVRFRVGVSRTGDRLVTGGSEIECIIRRAAPAHTIVLFSYA